MGRRYVRGFNAVAKEELWSLPAALPLFATGLGGLGLLGWRRKRKAQAIYRTAPCARRSVAIPFN
jgi:hypothetical protein